MGHFGRRAIRVDWFAAGHAGAGAELSRPGGARVLDDPAAAANPFFLLFPGRLLYPAVALATAATVIASQAVISGAFALVQQAIQLGAVPRLEVRQTSEETVGQVYVPQINWLLAAAVLVLVFGFRSSEALANAYGIAVAGDMLVTTLLMGVVAHGRWSLPWLAVAAVAGPFLLLDLTFVSGNLHKIPGGGWFPLLVGAAALTLMLIWRRGRAVLLARRDEGAPTLSAFIASLGAPGAPLRVPGVAVYLTGQQETVPAALALNLRHNGVLHESVVLLHVRSERVPRIARDGARRGRGAAAWVPPRHAPFRLRREARRACSASPASRGSGVRSRGGVLFPGQRSPRALPAARAAALAGADLCLSHPQCGSRAGLLPDPAATGRRARYTGRAVMTNR